MPRFQIDWDVIFDGNYNPFFYLFCTKYEFYEGWSLVCIWKRCRERLCKLDSIQIWHDFKDNEKIQVSGTLTLRRRNGTETTESFSKVMESDCVSPNFNNLDPKEIFNMDEGVTCFSLHGVLNITSFSEKCSSDVNIVECKKCIPTTTLLQLSNDFESLLDPETCCFSDVSLKCKNVSFPAHKNILSARSPVFAAMFKNPMKESHKNEVDISDTDESVMRALLTYIYTGKYSSLTISSASELLQAADKYQLLDLKKVCSEFLKDNTSLVNVLSILVLGDLLSEDLKSYAVDFMCNNCKNFSEFQKTEEWIMMKNERPTLALDVLTSLVISRDQK